MCSAVYRPNRLQATPEEHLETCTCDRKDAVRLAPPRQAPRSELASKSPLLPLPQAEREKTGTVPSHSPFQVKRLGLRT